jgi:hypothetical protein
MICCKHCHLPSNDSAFWADLQFMLPLPCRGSARLVLTCITLFTVHTESCLYAMRRTLPELMLLATGMSLQCTVFLLSLPGTSELKQSCVVELGANADSATFPRVLLRAMAGVQWHYGSF